MPKGGNGGGGGTHLHTINSDGISTALTGTKRADLINGSDLLSETITGNRGNDLIYANGGEDTVSGGVGNDRMDGGGGTDIAVFTGTFSDYTFSLVPNTIPNTDPIQALQVVGPDGTDLLVNFELLQFGTEAPRSVASLLNNPPTGIPDTTRIYVDENVAYGSELPGGFLTQLTAADAADGDQVSYYFKNSSGPTQTIGIFHINADTGVVTTTRPLDYEVDGASVSFTAFAGDGKGGEDSGLYTVQVRNVADENHTVDFTQNGDLGVNVAIPPGYGGFDWSGIKSGFTSAAYSDVADSWFERSDGSTFDLISLKLADYGVHEVKLTAYDYNGLVIDSTTVPLGFSLAEGTTTLNWSNIARLHIEATSGSDYWVMDDLLFHEHLGVDFEGTVAAPSFDPLPSGYGGLNWDSSNGAYGAPDIYGGNPTRGINNDQVFNVAADNEIAWNGGAGQNTVISRGDTSNFNLKSMDLIGAAPDLVFMDGATQVHITAYDSDSPTTTLHETDVFLTNNLVTTTFNNWNGVDTITIDVVAGGAITGTSEPTGLWAMDNLIFV